jgi:hypothetical protein
MADGIGSKLSQAILDRMNAAGIETSDLDMKKLANQQVGALRRPAISVAVDTMSFKKVTMNTTYKVVMMITLFLMVSNVGVKGEELNRKNIINLIEAIVDSLLLEKLGLPLQDPLIPVSTTNLTGFPFSGAGYLVYELKFTCSYNFEHIPDNEKDLGRLKKIVVDYFIHPDDDGIKDASSEISLTGLDGGDAYSEFGSRQVDGGSAGSKYKTDPYDGGDARSTY